MDQRSTSKPNRRDVRTEHSGTPGGRTDRLGTMRELDIKRARTPCLLEERSVFGL